MAQQNTRSTEQERRQPGDGGSSNVARRNVSDPFGLGFPISPFFTTSPLSLMRRMMFSMEPDQPFVPAVEVANDNGNYVVRADLPGMKPKDVKVEVTDDAVVLEGERRCETKADGGTRSERLYGHFVRSIPLPDGADAEHAKARFENGVLEITVPVAGSRSREIPIETSSTSSTQTK